MAPVAGKQRHAAEFWLLPRAAHLALSLPSLPFPPSCHDSSSLAAGHGGERDDDVVGDTGAVGALLYAGTGWGVVVRLTGAASEHVLWPDVWPLAAPFFEL